MKAEEILYADAKAATMQADAFIAKHATRKNNNLSS